MRRVDFGDQIFWRVCQLVSLWTTQAIRQTATHYWNWRLNLGAFVAQVIWMLIDVLEAENATTNANKVARIDLDVFLSAPHT
jgi:hypothetical protein